MATCGPTSSEEPEPGRIRDAACCPANASFAKLVTICEDVSEVNFVSLRSCVKIDND